MCWGAGSRRTAGAGLSHLPSGALARPRRRWQDRCDIMAVRSAPMHDVLVPRPPHLGQRAVRASWANDRERGAGLQAASGI